MKPVSLRTKLLLSTVLACSLIVLVISVFDLFRFRDAEKSRIQEEFLNFERGAKRTIREAVWRYDWDMVRTILESQTSQVISFVEICDNKVSRCLRYGIRDTIPYLEFRTPIIYGEGGLERGERIEIGSIYLQSHYETLLSHMHNDFPRLLLTNVLSVFGVALILFYLFHRQVVQRLLALEHYTRKIDLQRIGSMTSPASRDKENWRDEIDLLGDAVSGLIEKTKGELERRQGLEKQLNQAQKMEALGNLAGGIAHDFNNILAAILGFAELSYLKSQPGSEISNNLEKIIRAGQRARNLTSQILVFSRRTESPQEILRLATVVEEALNLMRASLPASIRIETDLDQEIRIKGDSTRLHQVIMNVATNGAQAIGSKAGTLKISLSAVSLDREEAEKLVLEPGNYCCLRMSDDGAGIPEEIQPRVFEPFFTTKQAGKGTGMGLAVVHGIVRNHGGAIIMDSKEGEGTTFSIYLPRTEQQAVENDRSAIIPRGKGQRMILIDDEPQVLEMGRSILESLGYTVICFQEPRVALDYLRRDTQVDLVVTDLTMPEMSGVEVASTLKARNPDLPVMLWTGYKDDIAEECLGKGLVNHILQKPFDIEELAQAVSRVVQSR